MSAPALPRWPSTPEIHPTFSRNYGEIQVHERTSSFGFQLQIQSAAQNSSVWFSLSTPENHPHETRLAIRLDLRSGDIWDIANEAGVIGWMDSVVEWENFQNDQPLLLRWEVEHQGGALIPRLQIGEEEWLYPSVLFPGPTQLIAAAAHDLPGYQAEGVFTPGYVWCQDRLK